MAKGNYRTHEDAMDGNDMRGMKAEKPIVIRRRRVRFLHLTNAQIPFEQPLVADFIKATRDQNATSEELGELTALLAKMMQPNNLESLRRVARSRSMLLSDPVSPNGATVGTLKASGWCGIYIDEAKARQLEGDGVDLLSLLGESLPLAAAPQPHTNGHRRKKPSTKPDSKAIGIDTCEIRKRVKEVRITRMELGLNADTEPEEAVPEV